ncbi:type II toxin-antitoxin system VapC family toxin [Nocardioides hungaricus]
MIVDANVLIYAVHESSAFHREAREWLADALNGATRIGLPWVSLTAFQRITTHPRAFAAPLSPDAAWSHVTDWLSAEQAWVPTPGPRHAEILGPLLVGGDLRGNLVPDAHLAALALEHGVGVCSFDSDFARFEGLPWTHPARRRPG